MDTGYLVLFGAGLGLMAFLLWMLFPLPHRSFRREKDKVRGNCPICGQPLHQGERIRSSVTEIGDVEVRTYIKGCPFCLEGNRKRTCPVCKRKLKKNESIMALSDPRIDRKKLTIKGCHHCFPGGFD